VRSPEEAAGLLLLCLVVLLIMLAVADGLRGPRSWREWFDSLR
jgi:hypothetical protein